MKGAAIILLLSLAALGADPAAELESLKAQFPAHIAGPVTPASDPAVQQLFSKYRQRVEALNPDILPEALRRLQREAERDLAWAEKAPARKSSKMTSSQRHAIRQNAVWLRQKLIPYLHRLAQLQRGR